MERSHLRWLKLRQLDKKLGGLRIQAGNASVPANGWIKAVREALGMSAAQLAARLGVNQSTVTRLEQSERDATITLASLQKAAQAMNCDLHYGLVPRESLEKTVRMRAAQVAAEDIARVSRTMALEDQSADSRFADEQQEVRTETLLRGSWRNLWK